MNFGSKTVDREGVGDSQEIHLILSNAKTCSEFKIQHIIERRLLKTNFIHHNGPNGINQGYWYAKKNKIKARSRGGDGNKGSNREKENLS